LLFPLHIYFLLRAISRVEFLSAAFIIYLLDHYFRLHGRERSENANYRHATLGGCASSHILTPENGGEHKSGIKNNRRQLRALFIFCVGRNNLTDTCRGNIQAGYVHNTVPGCGFSLSPIKRKWRLEK
jgi:hypothetical protein